MRVTFDPAKRDWTLAKRRLDFADAEEVFAGTVITIEDSRVDYGEVRFVSVGDLRGRMVVVCWTPRGDARHVFSMRKANVREQKRFGQQLGGS